MQTVINPAAILIVHVEAPRALPRHQVDPERCDACGHSFCASCDGERGDVCVCGPCIRHGFREAA